ncbi:MAG: ribonuclease P protein component [Synergistaceae bacterium]|nr:ribonuclease P protein component [Synergistaceae bacterium]
MPNIHKLKKGWEFDKIFRTGIKVNGELVRLLYLKDDSDSIKFGCAVGKHQGKANIRNRGKRILREAFRQLSGKLTPGLQIVLGLKDKGLDSKTQDIYRELLRLLRHRNLLSCYPVSQSH